MKNQARCIEGLATMTSDVEAQFITLLSPLTARNAPFVEEKSDKSPEISPRSSGLFFKNYARCNWGLATTMQVEVNVLFIALLGSFDRTHRSVSGGKVGQVT